MPEKIKLDDSSYSNIQEKAMERLEKQAPWWTHREISDPGITLLEMWSLLCDMQSFYLDQVQESHYRKYLKLLGIAPDEGKSASVWVFFDGAEQDFILPEGTRLLADKMVFETAEEVKLTANQLTAFYLGQEPSETGGRNLLGIMNRSRKTRFPLENKDCLFCLVLEEAVSAGEEITFFVLLDEKNGRTPMTGEVQRWADTPPMVQLSWEYLTEEGYREVKSVRDETAGLLYSGRVSLLLDEPVRNGKKNGCTVRCRVKKGAYDIMPVIYRIFLNVVPAFQKNTLCREEYASFSPENPQIPLKSYLAQTGEIQVYVRDGENQWEDFTQSCEITPPAAADRRERYVRFDRERFGRTPMVGSETVKIVCSVRGVQEEYAPCAVTGVSTQRIPLPWENIMRGSVGLMLRQGSGTFRFRQYFPAEPEEERYPFVWHWLEEKNVIELGDGRHGEIPPAAEDGLRITSLVLWEGEKGNISIGRISELERPELFPGVTCRNLMTGRGGRDRVKPSLQFAGIRQQLSRLNRMVTQEDIRRIALETPGLILQDVRAEWTKGKILVTVFPAGKLEEEYCKERYRAAVREHLEQYRLVGSLLEVVIETI